MIFGSKKTHRHCDALVELILTRCALSRVSISFAIKCGPKSAFDRRRLSVANILWYLDNSTRTRRQKAGADAPLDYSAQPSHKLASNCGNGI